MMPMGTHLDTLVPMVFVADVRRSIAFYERLGFSVRHTFVPDGRTEPSWAWLESGGARLMVSRAGEPVDPERQSVLFYLYCDDVPAFHTALREAGVEAGAIQYPFYCPRGEFRVVDPDGFTLMVAHT